MAAGANGLGRRVFEGRGKGGLGGKERKGPLMGVPRSHVDIRNCNEMKPHRAKLRLQFEDF